MVRLRLMPKSEYRVGDYVSLFHKRRKVLGCIVGIDKYVLQPFSGPQACWISYTLVSSEAGVFSRYWVVCWGRTEWILWLKTSLSSCPKRGLLSSKSGIATISFAGDAGVSTPVAALLQYKDRGGYFCAEKFMDSKSMYFRGYAIKAPALHKVD